MLTKYTRTRTRGTQRFGDRHWLFLVGVAVFTTLVLACTTGCRILAGLKWVFTNAN